jgi:hypothetical protein
VRHGAAGVLVEGIEAHAEAAHELEIGQSVDHARRQAHGGRGDRIFELAAMLGKKALGIGLLGEDAHLVGLSQFGIKLGQRHLAVLKNAWSVVAMPGIPCFCQWWRPQPQGENGPLVRAARRFKAYSALIPGDELGVGRVVGLDQRGELPGCGGPGDSALFVEPLGDVGLSHGIADGRCQAVDGGLRRLAGANTPTQEMD